jgi:hypothetical protein
MALKYEIDNLDGVSDALKTEYEKTGEGKYRLKVDGVEDVTGLKKNRDDLLSEQVKAKERIKAMETELEEFKKSKAKGSGNYDDVVKMYEDKINAIKTETETNISQMRSQIGQLTAGAEATKLAAKLARTVKGEDGKDYSTIDVLEPLIKQRTRTDIKDGKAVLVVLDKNGNPTVNTMEDLEKEIVSNPAYSPLITGSKASGAADQGAGPGKMADNDIMKLSPVERMKEARRRAAAGKK